MSQIIIYTTAGCHLCDIAKELLVKANDKISFNIIDMEISNDDSLISLYGKTIPVIEFEKGKQLNWPFKLKDIIFNIS